MLMILYATAIDLTRATEETLPGSGSTFPEWLSRIAGGVMVIGALLVLIYLLWGGIAWITAAGDSNKVSAARDKITQAIIGLIVLAASLAIFMLVQSFLGVKILNFTGGTEATSTTRSTPESAGPTLRRISR